MLIEARDALFGYGKRPVVQVDSLHLDAGRSLGIFGPNGSGKTTLVRGLSGLLPALSGAVTRRSPLRIGYLPQYRSIDRSWPMSGLDAALLATSARARFGWITPRDRAAARAALSRLGVLPIASARFATLSGGQQQRLLLAGALAADPDLLLLDEPTDGLDVHSRQTLLELLREFTSTRLAIVIISHDVEDLLAACDSIARIHPAEDVTRPAQVELLTPAQFAAQLTTVSLPAEARTT